MKGQPQQSPSPFWLTKGFFHPREGARQSHILGKQSPRAHIFHSILGGTEAGFKEECGILGQQRRSWNLPSPQRAALREGKALSQVLTLGWTLYCPPLPSGSRKQVLHWQAWQGKKAQTLRAGTPPPTHPPSDGLLCVRNVTYLC